MAREQSTPLRRVLSRWFPSGRIQELAVAEGVVRRRRRVDPVALLWVVVLGVGEAGGRTMAALHRSYERVTGCRLARSSFYQRFTAEFARLLKRLLTQALERVGDSAGQGVGLFGEIREVLCVDSTVVSTGYIPDLELRGQEVTLRVATDEGTGLNELDFDVAQLFDGRL